MFLVHGQRVGLDRANYIMHECVNPSDKKEVFDKIRGRIKTMNYAAEFPAQLSRDFGVPVEDLQKFKGVVDPQVEGLVRYAEEQIKKNIDALKMGGGDEWLVYVGFLRNMEYWERYGIGDIKKSLDALLIFAKRVERDPNLFPSEVIDHFLKYKYIPKDPFFRELARKNIISLLKFEERSNPKLKKLVKKRALETLEGYIQAGILDEKEDEDIIEEVTR